MDSLADHTVPAFGERYGGDGGGNLACAVLVALVILIVAAIGFAAYRAARRGPARAGFYWADWAENTDRENLTSPYGGPQNLAARGRRSAGRQFEGYDQRKRRHHREGFGAHGIDDPFGGHNAVNPLSPFREYDPAYDLIPKSTDWSYKIGKEGFLAPSGGALALQLYESGGEDAGAGGSDSEGPNARGNILTGPFAGIEGFEARESFSPDMPGSCQQKRSRAGRAELDALRVAAGL